MSNNAANPFQFINFVLKSNIMMHQMDLKTQGTISTIPFSIEQQNQCNWGQKHEMIQDTPGKENDLHSTGRPILL